MSLFYSKLNSKLCYLIAFNKIVGKIKDTPFLFQLCFNIAITIDEAITKFYNLPNYSDTKDGLFGTIEYGKMHSLISIIRNSTELFSS